jgi:hypothetical protein
LPSRSIDAITMGSRCQAAFASGWIIATPPVQDARDEPVIVPRNTHRNLDSAEFAGSGPGTASRLSVCSAGRPSS